MRTQKELAFTNKVMKIKVTYKELLLAAGVLVALALFLLYWTNPSALSLAAPVSSEYVRIPNDLQTLLRATFSFATELH